MITKTKSILTVIEKLNQLSRLDSIRIHLEPISSVYEDASLDQWKEIHFSPSHSILENPHPVSIHFLEIRGPHVVPNVHERQLLLLTCRTGDSAGPQMVTAKEELQEGDRQERRRYGTAKIPWSL